MTTIVQSKNFRATFLKSSKFVITLNADRVTNVLSINEVLSS